MPVHAAAVTGHEPWHRFDLTLAKHYSPALRTALRALIGDLTPAVRAYVHRARGQAQPLPGRHELHKAYGSHGDPAAQAQAVAAAQAALEQLLAGDMGPILEVLQELYGDAYLAGAHAAAAALAEAGLAATVAAGFGALDAKVNWEDWQPGWGQAADELAGSAGGRGLDVLLSQAQVTIRGIEGTTLDRLAALLAEGVESGASVDTISDDIEAFVGSSVRADMIAITEVARAMTVATLDTYQANGLTQWNWLTTPGACPECAAEESANPHPLSDAGPPAHPRCRCVAAPVVDIPSSPAGLDLTDAPAGAQP